MVRGVEGHFPQRHGAGRAQGQPGRVKSIADLARPDLRVGLAHPVNSALGALTDDLLKKLKLHDKVYDPARKHPVVHSDAGHALVNQMRAGAWI